MLQVAEQMLITTSRTTNFLCCKKYKVIQPCATKKVEMKLNVPVTVTARHRYDSNFESFKRHYGNWHTHGTVQLLQEFRHYGTDMFQETIIIRERNSALMSVRCSWRLRLFLVTSPSHALGSQTKEFKVRQQTVPSTRTTKMQILLFETVRARWRSY